MATLLWRALAFACLWWVLAEGRLDGWPLGLTATVLATWTSLKWLPPARGRIAPLGLFAFLVFFIRSSVLGGFQVARLACQGKAALRPAVILLTTDLPPGAARLLLASTIGLMPGTLVVDMDGPRLHLHVLDDRLPAAAEVRTLEAAIRRVFGLHI